MLHAQLDHVFETRPVKTEFLVGIMSLGILIRVVEVAEKLRLLQRSVDSLHFFGEGGALGLLLFLQSGVTGFDHGRGAEFAHLIVELLHKVMKQAHVLNLLLLDFLLTCLCLLDFF